MKFVMVMAMVSVISFHASAQKQETGKPKSGQVKSANAKKSSAGTKPSKASKKFKVAPVAIPPGEIAEGGEGETSLVSEGKYQAKSRFHWMLAKRVKIDAEDHTNMGGLKPAEPKRKQAVVNNSNRVNPATAGAMETSGTTAKTNQKNNRDQN